MIDEPTQELASLYAFDLLEGEELASFESRLAQDRELRVLVRDLRESTSQLSWTAAPALPPSQLKARLLEKIRTSASPRRNATSKTIPFPVVSVLPWMAAAGFALVAAWFGQGLLARKAESIELSTGLGLAQLARLDAENRLKAEQILLNQQLANSNQQLTQVVAELSTANDRAVALGLELKLQRDLALALENRLKTERIAVEQQLVQSNQQLARTGVELAAANQRNAELGQELKSQGDLAQFKIATLASMLDNSPQAQAVAVWNPLKQEGVFTVNKLPVPATDQDYELWVIDAQKTTPVSAGVFKVGANGDGRVTFKTESPINSIAKFAVSREKKGGAPAHGGPKGQVVMISQ